MREKISDNKQASYWNHIAKEYKEITRIKLDDFHYGPQIPGESSLQLLPKYLVSSGKTSLELGCGGAQNSIYLAKHGLICHALDISNEQLKNASIYAKEQCVSINFICDSLTNFKKHFPEDCKFDFIHSSHAMEFIQEPFKIISDMASSLKKDGVLMISTVHPLYNGEWVNLEFETEDGDITEKYGQFIQNYFEPTDDIRDEDNQHVISRAYPVSKWFTWFRDAGLDVIAISEPAAIKDAPYTSDDWADHDGQLDAIPSTIIIVGVKK